MFARVNFSKLTLMDALDLASLIEVEAFQRYNLFAAQLGYRDPSDAASVFRTMAANEKKHGDQLARRRQTLFGDTPAKVKLDDLFDVEAPYAGSASWNMSARKAFEVALAAEKQAFAFYDEALPSVKQLDVKALFEELRDEEAEHIQMVEAVIAKLPPSAAIELEDVDAD
jgi:erythrin-vacuolar iron transport family protein